VRDTFIPVRELCLAVLLGFCGHAQASFFSAEADVVFFNQATFTVVKSGDQPTGANTGPRTAADGLRTSQSFAQSAAGQLNADVSSRSGSSKITGVYVVSATYDDIVFSSTSVPSGTLVSASLFYNVSANQQASGSLGNAPGFNSRQLDYSVTFNGSQDSGQIVFDVGGSTGTALLGSHVLRSSTLIALDTPVSVTLAISGGAQARLGAQGPAAQTSIQAMLNVTQSAGVFVPPSFASGATAAGGLFSPVFDLPAGITVNSVSMGVVDNHWVAAAVPELPAGWLLASGLSVLALRAGSRRSRTRGAAR
jgi:hypothetical protein